MNFGKKSCHVIVLLKNLVFFQKIWRNESNSQRQEISKIKIFKILRSASLNLLQVAMSIPFDMSSGCAKENLCSFFCSSDDFYFGGSKITHLNLQPLAVLCLPMWFDCDKYNQWQYTQQSMNLGSTLCMTFTYSGALWKRLFCPFMKETITFLLG